MFSPSVSKLTAPSEKEPDIALSDSFGFCPLSPADSSPRGRAEKNVSLSRESPKDV